MRGRHLVQGRGRSRGGARGRYQGVQVGGDQVRGQVGVQQVSVQARRVMEQVRQREGGATRETRQALIGGQRGGEAGLGHGGQGEGEGERGGGH